MTGVPLKVWISAARLRTLPLAVAATLMGNILALLDGVFRVEVLLLAIFTAVLFQILSNYANDYGDFKKGVDNDKRLGPQRVMQSGTISPKTMLTAIKSLAAVSFISAVVLLWVALGTAHLPAMLIMTLLAILAIWAAISYTATKKPYGYRGLGDLFVFLFFGIVAIMGNYFLQTLTVSLSILLPAIALGLLSTAVLNLNNMRDHDNDKANKKRTLVVLMGPKKALFYHFMLVTTALVALLAFMFNRSDNHWCYLFLLSYPIFFIHLIIVGKKPFPKVFNGQLKVVSLATLFLVLLLTVSTLFNLC